MIHAIRLRPQVVDDLIGAMEWYNAQRDLLGDEFLQQANDAFDVNRRTSRILSNRSQRCPPGVDEAVSLRNLLPDRFDDSHYICRDSYRAITQKLEEAPPIVASGSFVD